MFKRETHNKVMESKENQNKRIDELNNNEQQQLLRLQQEYNGRKKEYLLYIHQFDLEFKFKKIENDNQDIQKRLSLLDEEFCNKCNELTNNIKIICKKEEEKSNNLKELIQINNESIKESKEIYFELEEASKKLKLKSEIYIDKDIIYKSYNQLKDLLYNYFKSQDNIKENVNNMIQILLDNIINNYSFQELKSIENLFNNSKKDDWILNIKKQVIKALLDQELSSIDTKLIIDLFEKEYKILIKLDDNLTNAILISNQLSIYTIAKEYYFKYGLTLEGLEKLKLKDDEPILNQRSSPPKYIPSLELILPPSLLQETKNSLILNETILQRNQHVVYSTSNDQLNRLFEVSNQRKIENNNNNNNNNNDLLISDFYHDEKKEKLKEWKKHINHKEDEVCSWCKIYSRHRTIENDKSSKTIESDCIGNILCYYCKSVKEHKYLKCEYKVEGIKCKKCQELKLMYENL